MATAIIGKVVSKKSSKPAVKAKAQAKAKKPAKVEEKNKVAEKPTKAAKPTTWPEKFKAGTIGRTIAELIMDGTLKNNEILEKVKEKHSEASTTIACVSWYKSKYNQLQKQ